MTLKLFRGARRLLSKFWVNQPVSTLNQIVNIDGSDNPRSFVLPKHDVNSLNAMSADLGSGETVLAANPTENFLMLYNTNYYSPDDYNWRRIDVSLCDCVVYGYVKSFFTNLPVEGFTVTINGRSSVTNASGYFEVIVSEEGTHIITGSKTGYENILKNVKKRICDPLDLLCDIGPGDGYLVFDGAANDLVDEDVIKELDAEAAVSSLVDTYSVGVIRAYENHIKGIITDSVTNDPIGREGVGGPFGEEIPILITGASPPGQMTDGQYRLNPFDPDYAPGNANPIAITATSDFYDTFTQTDVEANLTGVREYDFEMDPV